MKILELEISNIRGIKQIKISPNGENVVVFGPNGTGKSAIVDGVDFLLTGRIARLAGEGSKVLSLKEHGPHVDYRDKLKDVIVKAKIKINEGEPVIEIERQMTNPMKLRVSPSSAEGKIQACLAIAKLGQHLLSRREILKYITAEAGKRAAQVQSLLNLEQIENLRTSLVTIRNQADEQFKSSESDLKKSEFNLQATLSVRIFSVQTCIDKINELRRTLGAVDVTTLNAKVDIKKDITPPSGLGKPSELSLTQIQNYIAQVRKLLASKGETVQKEAELRQLLDEIAKDVKLKTDLLHKRLLDLGISLLDESNTCPLCEREWTRGSFKDYLAERIRNATVAQEKQDLIARKAALIKQSVDVLWNAVSQLLQGHEQFGLEVVSKEEIERCTKDAKAWVACLLSPEEHHQTSKWPATIEGLFDENFVERKLLQPLEHAVQQSGQNLSKELEAWDTLTRVETLWEQHQRASAALRTSSRFKKKAEAVLRAFEMARDSVLEGIYGAITDNFENYYKCIHGDDEANFSSTLKHKGPELNFEVDFHNRGSFPPHALHSEGHQDSMGVCLYFALNRYLAKNVLQVMVLDDVVMSIDRGHRRGVCGFLSQFFPDRQLIITTHDAAWARQLRTEGVVKRDNMLHFVNWKIETGPIIELERDFWDKIEEELARDDIPAAAHRLRWNAECFFENICDAFGAKIAYKGDYHWELGDYAPAAISAYRDYLKRAKKSAELLEQVEKMKQLEVLDKEASGIIDESQIEQWVINENVHYNKWSGFSKQDIVPVIKAFKDLFSLFTCPSCKMVVSVSVQGRDPKCLSCRCGEFYWDLLSAEESRKTLAQQKVVVGS